MERIEHTFPDLDKSTWGEGPWQNEPDKVQWTDPTTGYPCLIVRSPFFGHLCGYAGVAEGHPLFGKSFHEAHLDSGHGSVNFSGPCNEEHPELICHAPAPGEPDRVWWFGFDCGHFSDISPAMEARQREWRLLPNAELEHAMKILHIRYRDVAYVTERVAELAAELKSLEK